MDVAHPAWWKDSNGNNPNPFTIITAQDVKDGVWTPTIPALRGRMCEYTEELEKGGRYPLCIWPPHCLIGSEGGTVVPELQQAFYEWETTMGGSVNFVSKGSNPFTEHYGALRAEVPDPTDFSTQTNTKLVEVLEEADMVAIAGEAGSHCLANTVRDIANEFQDPNTVKKLVLLTEERCLF
jgi:nicotinamidase-related amidase